MHEARHWRVGCLVERVQRQFGVVGQQVGLERQKLAKDRVVSWILPVDSAENVWSEYSCVHTAS